MSFLPSGEERAVKKMERHLKRCTDTRGYFVGDHFFPATILSPLELVAALIDWRRCSQLMVQFTIDYCENTHCVSTYTVL